MICGLYQAMKLYGAKDILQRLPVLKLSSYFPMFIWAALASSVALQAVTIPTGTPIQIRLTSPVDGKSTQSQSIQAVVFVPVFLNGAPVISPGTQVSGEVTDNKTSTDNNTPASLRLVFEKIGLPNGTLQPFSANLQAIDNARESVGAQGLVTGITVSKTWGGRLDQGLGKLSSRYPEFGQLLGGVRDAMVKPVDPSIEYRPGVEMTLVLTKPLVWNVPGQTFTVASIEPADQIASLVSSLPFRTTAQSPPAPSDLTNLIFIGTEQQVSDAFQTAGWYTAAALSEASKMETARAIIENRGYNEAPVSLLLLDGKAPDLVFQKQTNTFAMRHHIRIWRNRSTFNGLPVWIGAATHDIGIDFSEQSHSFTHKIDSNIDAERAKIVNDLLFAHSVQALAIVERPNIPANISNATGDALHTDNQIAVLLLTSPEKGSTATNSRAN